MLTSVNNHVITAYILCIIHSRRARCACCLCIHCCLHACTGCVFVTSEPLENGNLAHVRSSQDNLRGFSFSFRVVDEDNFTF